MDTELGGDPRPIVTVSNSEVSLTLSPRPHPTTLGGLYSAIAKLWKVTIRNDPDYGAIEGQFKNLKPYQSAEYDGVPAPPEAVLACHELLDRKIDNLKSSLEKAAKILDQDLSPTFLALASNDLGSAVTMESIAGEFSSIACRYALKSFARPPGYDSELLPPSVERLMRSFTRHLMLSGMIDRGFTKSSFDRWLSLVADVWKNEIFPDCLQTESEGAEYFFGDAPVYVYNSELEEDRALKLEPDLLAHSHLGFIENATVALDVLAADISVLRDLMKQKITPFLAGGILLQELCEKGVYSPSLSFRSARHEGAPGIEIALHPDRPVYDVERGLARVYIRFLNEETPVIVTCQGSSFRSFDTLLATLRDKMAPKTSPFIQALDSVPRLDDRQAFFSEKRRDICSSVGVRQATDGAILSAIVILRDLGFKSVLGISDADQHPLLDLNDIRGQSTLFYDPLFARLGFRPPQSDSRFWLLPLNDMAVWSGDRFTGFRETGDYFATVLARQSQKGQDAHRSTWASDHRLQGSSRQLYNFNEHLLQGAKALATAITQGKTLEKLAVTRT